MAAPRRAGPHLEAEVPHRGGERAHRERAARAQPGRAQPLAVARLGKDVVDLEDVSVVYPVADAGPRPGHEDRAARSRVAHRAGGAHGHPRRERRRQVDAARARHGCRGAHQRTREARQDRGIATLTQELAELAEWAEQRVSAVIAEQRTATRSARVQGGRAHARASCSSGSASRTRSSRRPVKDLSGGQKRRLQLLLILLSEPNVLILDEPTNDLDTDMLAAIEDLLDSWPGTLLVVSHDRYLLERVTDRQFAILDGHLRDLPRGVDQYLELRRRRRMPGRRRRGRGVTSDRGGRFRACGDPGGRRRAGSRPGGGRGTAACTGAERRTAEKERSSIDRKLEKLQAQIAEQHERLARHDQGDYVGLGRSATSSAGSRHPSPSSRRVARGVRGARGLTRKLLRIFIAHRSDRCSLIVSKHPVIVEQSARRNCDHRDLWVIGAKILRLTWRCARVRGIEAPTETTVAEPCLLHAIST